MISTNLGRSYWFFTHLCQVANIAPSGQRTRCRTWGLMGSWVVHPDGQFHDLKLKIDCTRYIPIPVAGHFFLDVRAECSRCSIFCFVAWLLRFLNFDIFARIWMYPVPCYLCNFWQSCSRSSCGLCGGWRTTIGTSAKGVARLEWWSFFQAIESIIVETVRLTLAENEILQILLMQEILHHPGMYKTL